MNDDQLLGEQLHRNKLIWYTKMKALNYQIWQCFFEKCGGD